MWDARFNMKEKFVFFSPIVSCSGLHHMFFFPISIQHSYISVFIIHHDNSMACTQQNCVGPSHEAQKKCVSLVWTHLRVRHSFWWVWALRLLLSTPVLCVADGTCRCSASSSWCAAATPGSSVWPTEGWASRPGRKWRRKCFFEERCVICILRFCWWCGSLCVS